MPKTKNEILVNEMVAAKDQCKKILDSDLEYKHKIHILESLISEYQIQRKREIEELQNLRQLKLELELKSDLENWEKKGKKHE